MTEDNKPSDEIRAYQKKVASRLNKALPKIAQRRDDPESLHALSVMLLNAAAHFAAMACLKEGREPRYEKWMGCADELIRESFERQRFDAKAFFLDLHADGAMQWKLYISAEN